VTAIFGPGHGRREADLRSYNRLMSVDQRPPARGTDTGPWSWRVGPLAISGILARSHLATWLAIVILAFFVGTAGYLVLFHWSLSDALYMTVITLTTVGYKEVRDLDDAGRAWTGVLTVAGVGIIFGTVGIVVESFVRELTSGRREERRMTDTITRLRDHFVLCGYGRVGSTVARELLSRGRRVVVVDIRPDSLERARRDGHLVVAGDAADDATLIEAGIRRARGLVTTLDSDANNVYVTLSARTLQTNLFILARANAAGSEAKLEQAGANRVVSPYTMAGRRIAELAIRPKLAEFIDLALSTGEAAFSLEEVEVAPGGVLAGRSVGELRADGVFTLAILRDGGEYQANPPDERRLVAGENLVLSGSSARLQQFRTE
jgi:voltage-gated potassium channel